MPRIDYGKNCIYSIKCKSPDKNFVYIGSTTNFTKRKYDHRKNALSNLDEPLYKCINDNGGWNNWEIAILEKIECTSKAETVQKENEFIEKLKNYKNPPILLNFPPKLLISPPNLLISPPETSSTRTNSNICKFCQKKFSRSDNLKRHFLICDAKIKNETKKSTEIEEYKKIIAEQQEQIAKLKPASNKKLSIKNTNNNIINNNNTNNITYRLEFGNENLHERLTEKEKKNILEKMHTSLIEYINLIHFSGKFPDCMNFFCTNLRSNYAQVYSEEQKQFITQFASDFLNTVIDTRLDEISTMFDEHKDKLEKIKIERLNKFFESMESTADAKSKRYMETIADVKMMAYNNKHKFDSQPSVITIQDK